MSSRLKPMSLVILTLASFMLPVASMEVSANPLNIVGLPCNKSSLTYDQINNNRAHADWGQGQGNSAVDLQNGDECSNNDVLASIPGIITYTTSDETAYCKDSNGNYLVPLDSNGQIINSVLTIVNTTLNLKAVYYHHTSPTLTSGTTVTAGQKIANIGSVGCSTGAHIHYELRRNSTDQKLTYSEWAFGLTTQYSGNKQVQLSGNYAGDSRSDLTFFNPSNGHWYVRPTGGGADLDITFGWSTTKPVGGVNIDGDAKHDLTIYEPSTGRWYIRKSSGGTDLNIPFGWSTALPIAGNYAGDSRSDLAIYEPSTGHWYIRPTGGGADLDIAFGWSTAIPVSGINIDGDSLDDLAIYEPNTGHWYIRKSSGGPDLDITFGWSTAIPVPGNYVGDSRTDLAIFDEATGHWYVRPTGGGSDLDITFGWNTTVPVGAMNVDTDSLSDLTIFDKTSGRWYVRPSAGGSDWNVLFGWSGVVAI